MTIRRASLILPCRRLEDFPTHVVGERAAELLAAWTALWHPAILNATGALPGWHPADEPPDPSELDGELVLVPGVSQQRLAGDWCDRVAATGPRNPPPVAAVASREQTVAAMLAAAGVEAAAASPELTADFLALGYAHLVVELLTRAMHYSSVLDTHQFTSTTLAAATAATAGDEQVARDELARAFDLLADARNHVYSVDYYLVDVTLLAESTLGAPLRTKLAGGTPTSVLASGELLERLTREEPDSLHSLRAAMEAGTACVIGGTFRGSLELLQSPESMRSELERGQQAAERHLGSEIEVFAQFNAAFSPLLPQLLRKMGFRAALHTAFDGGRLPKADQCKTRWGATEASSTDPDRGRTEIEALATVPLDTSRPESWLQFPERIGDSIAHDHVATILLAGWPGVHSEYYDDLRRAVRYGTVLGKLVTLQEYFRTTRETDEWTTFAPREYPSPIQSAPNLISSQVATRRHEVLEAFRLAAAGLASVAGLKASNSVASGDGRTAVVNPWNFAGPQFVDFDPLDFESSASVSTAARVIAEVPGCGYAASKAGDEEAPVALAEKRTLRNESLELTVSETTGGIQSVRMHRDRSTRLSQRLVFHDARYGAERESKMVAERVEITRSDALVGQITSSGRVLDSFDNVVARFRQSVRLARRLPFAFVEVELEPERMPEGDAWRSYFASRMAWADDALGLRRGAQWAARPCTGERIESPEWVEVEEGRGKVTVFSLGLPLHRQASPSWLDTLLIVADEEARRFQFALAIDEMHPTQAALGLITAGKPYLVELASPPAPLSGWFLHVGAKNVIITHIEPLAAPASGVRLRLLETEGLDTITRLTAFRPITNARGTDFRGNAVEVLSVSEGRAEFDIGAHEWIQVEAEW